MKVKLISHSQSPDGKSLQDIVAYCTRVSNPSNQNSTATNEKLIDNNHWSPLEMVNICLEIETTRDIARQILRHRSFSFQEFSQRYAVADKDFEVREARLQDLKNRQNSIETIDDELKFEWEMMQMLTPTRMYMNGSLRSWIHYINLRSSNGTQKEHREVVLECAKVIKTIFPLEL